MSGSNLHPDSEEMLNQMAVGKVYADETVAVRIEGLKNWLSNLHKVGESDAFLRVKDTETGKIYLIKEVK